MSTYTMVDGVSRELTSWPVMVDGVSRELESMTACVDGVQREIFTAAKHQWEKHAIGTFFDEIESSTVYRVSISFSGSYQRYLGAYKESGTKSGVKGYNLEVGDHILADLSAPIQAKGVDCRVTKKPTFNDDGYAFKVSTYQSGAIPEVLEIVESSDPNAYPENGIHDDGYWYVKL